MNACDKMVPQLADVILTAWQSGPSGQLNRETVGVNYRALDLLFALRKDRSAEWDFDIGVEMVEVRGCDQVLGC